ncbi:MBL fold metallo-hydrolase [Muriicola sp. Z0-33]|uniref:MBL fold metallo-hydrolase n=1 Tax=Muriicola sp. Z0-33 TaxID=2816957 RepID=UPI002237FC9B|nr:MBL fold metallo-hydrolase [Muriicola sp. Z0-33]MCW5515720.1 MBL fold metallo-hydrolase [Muriicola sp. Z0-33]
MIIKFYGTRGSIPVCESGFQEFGGNTTCVAVMADNKEGDVLIFDAGTGIRTLGKELMQRPFNSEDKIVLAFSHFHWDHLQGFPFFAPAYDPSRKIDIIALGEDLDIPDLKSIFTHQMESTYFPVSLDNMGANFAFHLKKKNEEVFQTGSSGRLLSNSHSHPGGAHGYRLEVNDKVFVYCTDVEHGDILDQNIVDFAKDADVLIHEAQYTPEELPKFKGWGHSSWEQAIEVAKLAGVKKLYMTHHDPEHNDDFIRAEEKKCQVLFKNCYFAREGDEIKI